MDAPAFPDARALRSVATVFLRRRPLVVAPMLAAVMTALALGDGPRVQVAVVAGLGTVALSFFSWEAWRGRTAWRVSDRGLLVSLVLTLFGIAAAASATGAARSPLAFMIFAPTVIGFAAYGRGRRSNLLLTLALLSLMALASLPPGSPFPPPSATAHRWLVVICAGDALVLLRLGVVALTDAHAAARQVAAVAGDDAVASAAARTAALEAMGAQVAHEVRNPLSAIRGLIEVLAEGSSDDRDRRRLDVMLGEVDRINGILTGYLALARPLDQMHPVPTDVGRLVGEIALLVEARAERAGVSLTVATPASSTPALLDPHRIKEALLNLVLNAIDATPPGGQIELGLVTASNEVTISVQDSGAGMVAQQLASVGTRFSSGRPGGTGLGLALARQAIEQHGGRLELSSLPGRGTLAQVIMPAVGV